MRMVVRIILLLLFVAMSLFVLIPSYQLLRDVRAGVEAALEPPPKPPVPPPPLVLAPPDPRLDANQQVEMYRQQVGAHTQRVNGFAQEVTAYTQQVNAYKLYAESSEVSRRMAAYQVVVKDTLLGLVPALVATLLGYAFTSGAASVLENRIRAKQNQPPQPLRLL